MGKKVRLKDLGLEHYEDKKNGTDVLGTKKGGGLFGKRPGSKKK